MKRGWLIANAILLAVFAGAIWMALEMALFDALGPGAGFFPFWLGVVGATMCALILFHVARGRIVQGSGEPLLPTGDAAWRTAALLGGTILATAAFEPVGYRITMLVFIVALLLALGSRHWVAIGLTALAGSFGVFHVFYHWLKVPLPIGAFGI